MCRAVSSLSLSFLSAVLLLLTIFLAACAASPAPPVPSFASVRFAPSTLRVSEPRSFSRLSRSAPRASTASIAASIRFLNQTCVRSGNNADGGDATHDHSASVMSSPVSAASRSFLLWSVHSQRARHSECMPWKHGVT